MSRRTPKEHHRNFLPRVLGARLTRAPWGLARPRRLRLAASSARLKAAGTEKTATQSLKSEASSAEAGAAEGASAATGAARTAPSVPEEYPLRSLPDPVPWSAVSCDQCIRWLGRLEGGNGHRYHAGCFATPGRRLPRGDRPTMVQG